MFQIDIKVNGQIKYTINGQNISDRREGEGGICVYNIFFNDQKFSLVHNKNDGVLRLASKAIARFCRLAEAGELTMPEITKIKL